MPSKRRSHGVAYLNGDAAAPADVSQLVRQRMQQQVARTQTRPEDAEQSQRTFSFNQQYPANSATERSLPAPRPASSAFAKPHAP
jgi:hypothetical protein